MYAVSNGKKQSVIKAPTGDEGSMLRVTLDPSGLYAAASCADKTILLFDISSGECLAHLAGHSGQRSCTRGRSSMHMFRLEGEIFYLAEYIFVVKLLVNVNSKLISVVTTVYVHLVDRMFISGEVVC